MTRRVFLLACASLLPAFAAAEAPRPAPEFVVRLVNGQQLLLSQFKGKVLAVEFLHTTCPHCQNASALMNKLYTEYGPKGFQPIGVAFNDMAALLVPDYVKQLGLTFPVGVATREEVLAFLEQQFRFVPILVFIDKNFKIRGQYVGDNDFFKNEEANMRSTIESLLKEPGGKSKTSARKPAAAKRAAR